MGGEEGSSINIPPRMPGHALPFMSSTELVSICLICFVGTQLSFLSASTFFANSSHRTDASSAQQVPVGQGQSPELGFAGAGAAKRLPKL